MNSVEQMNKNLSRSSAKAGIFFIGLAVLVFLLKSFTGYTNVTKVGTYDKCSVITYSEEYRSSRGGSYRVYYMEISQKVDKELETDFSKIYEDPENYNIFEESEKNSDGDVEEKVLFKRTVPYLMYRKFDSYDLDKVTLYKTSWGRIFPVDKPSCGRAEAERIYRLYDPPVLWYAFYAGNIILGLILLSTARKSKKTAENYDAGKVYEPEFKFDCTEDALVGLAHARIQREKAEALRQRKRRYGRGSYSSFNRYFDDNDRF